MKCLEKVPGNRYATAASLADDLGRYLRGESISVRSVNIMERLSRTLERTHLDAELHAWGGVLLAWAAIVFVTHIATTAVMFWKVAVWTSACYFGQFAAMGAAYVVLRPRRTRPAGAAEQHLWALWGGYIVACLLLGPVAAELPGIDRPEALWIIYPFAALLAGQAFSVVGACYWGRGYAFAACFFLLAAFMPVGPMWSSAEFGLLWTAALVAIGLRLRRPDAADRP